MSEKSLTRRITEAVDEGTTRVEEIHKAIADLPLKLLEQTGLFRDPAKEIRKVQDRTLGSIYGLVRDFNDRVGAFASDLLDRKPGHRAHHTAHT